MREAIDSALAQTYKNIEVIVVNDGSRDDGETERIALSYGDRIRYFAKENGGVATALNLGIKQANGEYISWLSHDDTYYPNKIEVQINELKSLKENERENTIIFSYFDTYKVEEKKKSFGTPNILNYSTQNPLYTYSMLDALFSSKIGGCTLLFPKRVFEKVGYFEEKYLTIQDYVLFIKLFKAGINFHYVNQNLITSRHHRNQGTLKLFPQHIKELNYLYRWAFDEFKNEFQRMPFWQFNNFLEIIRLRTLDKVYAYMLCEWANGEWNKGKPTIWMYWENKTGFRTPDFIRLCWKTIIFHNRYDFQIKILTEDDIDKYLPDINPSYVLLDQIAHKADYLRFNLLNSYGGIWLDSDFICVRSLIEIEEYIRDYGFVVTAYFHKAGRFFPIVSFLASEPNNPVCKKVISKMDVLIDEKVKNNIQLDWDEFAGWNLADVIGDLEYRHYKLPIEYFYPYKVFTEENQSFENSSKRAIDLLQERNPFSFGQSLANSNRTEKFKSLTEANLISLNNLVGDLFRLGNSFDYYQFLNKGKLLNSINSPSETGVKYESFSARVKRLIKRYVLKALMLLPHYRKIQGLRNTADIMLNEMHSLQNKMDKLLYKNSVLGRAIGGDLENQSKEYGPNLVKYMADTGIETDECLKIGCLPMKVHFYSPIPDIPELEKRKIWDKKSDLLGIDFRTDRQLSLFNHLGNEYGHECDWPLNPTQNPVDFYLNNGTFSYGCASALHTIIRDFKPKHFIEIGSGSSSKVISRAIAMNKKDDPRCKTEYIIVDPYPDETVVKQLFSVSRLIKEKVENVDIKLFDALEMDDILFIDSGHTVRTGGDVNFLLLEALPRLHPGVMIHFHDINLPYEYNKIYFTNPKFRVFWTEAYLLQAFLAFNRDFEVMLAMNYIQTDFMNEFCKAFPKFVLKDNWANSGSFWIRRVS